jgi:hypothetical protein
MVWGWGLIIAIAATIVFLVAFASNASAQTTGEVSAPATLADVAMPTNVIVDAFVKCIKATGKEKSCRQLAEREADRSEGTANSASKAQRSHVVIAPPSYSYGGAYVSSFSPYGMSYGYGSPYRSGGYSSGRVYSQPSRGQIAIPRAPVAQRRTAPPPAQ